VSHEVFSGKKMTKEFENDSSSNPLSRSGILHINWWFDEYCAMFGVDILSCRLRSEFDRKVSYR
jgi:hypothetical protein